MEIAFRVRKVLDQMMDDRGNTLQEPSKLYPYTLDLTLDQLRSKEGYPEEHLSSMYLGPDKPGSSKEIRTHLIFIPTKTEDDKKSIVKFTDRLGIFMKAKIVKTSDRIIIVSEIKLASNQTKNIIDKYSIIEPEYFIFSDLYINPTENKYVPKHTFLSDSETIEIFNKIKVDRLGRIKRTDPMVRWFGALPKQVVRIERHNFTVDTMIDESFYYRVVDS